MRARVANELIIMNLLVIMLILAIILFPSNILRVILGLPFVLFFPGYSLMAALFTGKDQMGGITKLVLSFGTSLAVVPIIGLILNYTPWGISLESILYSIALFILVTSIIAWLRRRRLAPSKQPRIEFQFRVPGWPGWSGSSRDKVLSAVLAVALLGALALLGYVIAMPRAGETSTEFYILNPQGKAQNYSRELTVGEEGLVTVGIVNRELEPAVYQVEITVDGLKASWIGPVTLNHNEKWEQEVSFTPTRAGPNQKVEFFLYKGAKTELCGTLHLWVDVREAP